MGTERKHIVAREASLDFKFRKISLTWILTLREAMAIMLEEGGPELAAKGTRRMAAVWAEKIGAHIVKEFDIPDTVEGALELMVIYNTIFTAADMDAYVEDGVGYFDLKDCTHWDMVCEPLGIRCDISCEEHEGPNIIKPLGEFNFSFAHCKPRGGSTCLYKISK